MISEMEDTITTTTDSLATSGNLENLSNEIAEKETAFMGAIEQSEFLAWCNETLASWGLGHDWIAYVRTGILLVVAVLLSFILWWGTRKILINILHGLAYRSKTKWDDYLVKNRFFAALAHLVPFLFVDAMIRIVFIDFKVVADFLIRVTDLAIVLIVMYSLLRFLNTARDILVEKPRLKDKPIESYVQLTKIVVASLMVILMISIAFKVDLIVVFTSMGALTAVILLVFKDTILGFVGSIQLATYDMIRVGDWITMEKYGADGDVIEITLATVKIQNFDKTITTIPTYSFISDSFKNWRGMTDSDGRRLTRSINIKIQSVKFCSPELLKKVKEVELIRSYVTEKEEEIKAYNENNDVNKSVLLNGRNQTNLGIFRYYITRFLENNSAINDNMTLMVRQLQPTETGIPLQVYAFTKTHDWAIYENEMADIFDHLLAAANYFDLEIFENPAGSDMRSLSAQEGADETLEE